jgi:hypothetical protein
MGLSLDGLVEGWLDELGRQGDCVRIDFKLAAWRMQHLLLPVDVVALVLVDVLHTWRLVKRSGKLKVKHWLFLLLNQRAVYSVPSNLKHLDPVDQVKHLCLLLQLILL